MSPADRASVVAATVKARLGHSEITVEIVDVLGQEQAGDVDLDRSTPLTVDERGAIEDALEPRAVSYIPVSAIGPETAHDMGERALLWLAEPSVVDGQVTVTSGYSCGFLCGDGVVQTLERAADGRWVVTSTIMQWES